MIKLKQVKVNLKKRLCCIVWLYHAVVVYNNCVCFAYLEKHHNAEMGFVLT